MAITRDTHNGDRGKSYSLAAGPPVLYLNRKSYGQNLSSVSGQAEVRGWKAIQPPPTAQTAALQIKMTYFTLVVDTYATTSCGLFIIKRRNGLLGKTYTVPR